MVNKFISELTEDRNLSTDDIPESKNSPARDYWTLWLIYLPQNSTTGQEQAIAISFLPTGDIDHSRTPSLSLALANEILAPLVQMMRLRIPNFDIWKLINWIFVSFYWLILSDFGQVSPTIHSNRRGRVEGSPIGVINQESMYYPPTNNIFVNDTLFQIYSTYFRNTLLPITDHPQFPEFEHLDRYNCLKPKETLFLRTYSCLERRWKGALSGIISVFAADYALILGAYSLVIFFVGWLQKRKENGITSRIVKLIYQPMYVKAAWRKGWMDRQKQ